MPVGASQKRKSQPGTEFKKPVAKALPPKKQTAKRKIAKKTSAKKKTKKA